MTSTQEWNDGIKYLIEILTSFDKGANSSKSSCYHFVTNNNQVIGYIRANVLEILKEHYQKYFIIDHNNRQVKIEKVYDVDYKTRSDAFDELLNDMRDKDYFKALRGWRNEKYRIGTSFYSEKLFEIERSAVGLFGFAAYGCHINGYVKEDGKYKIWLSRRSATKQTFPGMLDNLAAGGLAAGLSLLECAVKELDEESSINGDLSKTLKSVDAITYAYEDNDGIAREGEFIFDIRLPTTFVPVNKDGEAQSFYLLDIDQVKKAIISKDFKPNSALVTISFLIRKGLITPDNDANFFYLLENMHSPGL